MDIAAEATAITSLVAAADPNGRVYDHQKLPAPNDWAKFIAAFTSVVGGQRRVRTWTVQYLGEQRVPKTIARGARKVQRQVRWKVRAHLSWQDAADTELLFRTMVQTVVLALDAAPSKGNVYIDSDPCDVDLLDGAGVMLGDYLCHFAEIEFTAYAEDTLATA